VLPGQEAFFQERILTSLVSAQFFQWLEQRRVSFIRSSMGSRTWREFCWPRASGAAGKGGVARPWMASPSSVGARLFDQRRLKLGYSKSVFLRCSCRLSRDLLGPAPFGDFFLQPGVVLLGGFQEVAGAGPVPRARRFEALLGRFDEAMQFRNWALRLWLAPNCFSAN